ncbi:Endonuclease MutS2 [Methanolapillus ohkumae]|uniref:DNA-binding protein MutS2 n=2 Tax=Methanolapillus ohkumae TaxID=3028298 RepID=A0AA96ZXU5_9EURY|nr:Endonuclease MutS2 [Methanosarcinaceae archaeon Am2]
MVSSLHLRDIAGIGPILEKRLITHFKSEEKALFVLLKGEIRELCLVEGMTKKAAQSLISNVVKSQTGICAGDFLKTKEAESLYLGILKILKKYCHTAYASDYMDLFIPYPKQKSNRREEVSANIQSHMDLIHSFSEDEIELISNLLSQITPARTAAAAKIKDKVILTFTEKTYLSAKEKFGKNLAVHWVLDPQEAADLLSAYPSVILFEFPEFDIPDGYEYFRNFENLTLEQIVPEIALDFFIQNQKSILASLKLAEIMAAGTLGGVYSKMTAEAALSLRTLVSKIDASGNFAAGFDPESDRLNLILKNCEEIFLKSAGTLSSKIEQSLSSSTLTLDGAQMMKVMSGIDLKEIVFEKVSKNCRGFFAESLAEISEKLALKKDEDMLLWDVFGDEISCPVQIQPDVLSRFKKHISSKITERNHSHKKSLSKELAGQKEMCESLITACLESDVWFSVAAFALAHEMTFPKWEERDEKESRGGKEGKSGRENGSGKGDKNLSFSMDAGKNLFLSQKYGLSHVVPVSYATNSVTILSGVNSGGKTSLLELLGQCFILAHMGFPVPAQSFSMSSLDEFYYFGKSKGTLDAGAFETTLRNFAAVFKTKKPEREKAGLTFDKYEKKKAVFADELEAITEPGASAKIIAGLLEAFCADGNALSLFVSHLAEPIMKNCSIPVQVDGIEAKGLDENLNLVVDRNPVKNHIAKSTPELIVEKLFLSASGEDAAFYEKLKAKF